MARMKFQVSLFVLLIGLALVGCHRFGSYSATATIEIKGSYQPYENGIHPTPGHEMQDEFEVIESPDVLSPNITDLQLDRIWAKRLNKGNILPMQDALAYLVSHLKLANRPDTSIIDITVFSDVPQEAANTANAMADRYKAMRDNAETQLSLSGISVLKDQITQQQQAITDAEGKTKQYPQDAKLQKQVEIDRSTLQALKIKLEEYEIDAKQHNSPVTILSRADPPPE